MNLPRGFTLVELLISVGIIAIVTAITLPNFGDFSRRNALDNTTNEFVADVRAAVNKSL